MNKLIRLTAVAAILASAGAANALDFQTASGASFTEQFLLTPTADNTAVFSVSGLANQFSALSFSIAGGPSVTGALRNGSWVAAFNDGRNGAYTLTGNTDYTVTIAGITLANVPGNFGLVSVNTLNGSVVAVPEPETFAMLLAGLGVVGMVSRRRKKCVASV